MNKFLLPIVCTLSLAISACGGSEGDSESGEQPVNSSSKILIIDGAWQGVSVCVDENRDLVCSADEDSSITDSNGYVTFVDNIPEDVLLLAAIERGISVDSVRGITKSGIQYIANGGDKVISPWTTLAFRLGIADSEDPLSIIYDSFSTIGTVEELKQVSESDWTKNPSLIAKRFTRLSEVAHDILSEWPNETQSILDALESVSSNIAVLSESQLQNYYPEITKQNQQFIVADNFMPERLVTNISQEVLFEGDAIEDIDLSKLFQDSDSDILGYEMIPSIPGLNISSGILKGIPENGLYKVQITASDSKSTSYPIYFSLSANGEMKPTPTSKQLADYNYGVEFDHRIYLGEPIRDTFVALETDSQLGVLYVKVFDMSIGEHINYSFRKDWNLERLYSVYSDFYAEREPDSRYVGHVENGIAVDSTGNFYFSALDLDGNMDSWMLTFSDDMEPSLITYNPETSPVCFSVFGQHRSSTSLRCHDISTGNISGTGLGITIGDLYVNGLIVDHYAGTKKVSVYRINTNKDDYQKTDFDVIFKDSNGMDFYDAEYMNMFYNEELNKVFIGFEYFLPNNMQGFGVMAIDLETLQSESYSHVYEEVDQAFGINWWESIVVPTPTGLSFIEGKIFYNFNALSNSFSSTTAMLDQLGDGSDSDYSTVVPYDHSGDHLLIFEHYNRKAALTPVWDN